MSIRKRGLAALAVVAVVGSLVMAPVTAEAATTYDVTVGKFLRGAPAESMRFFPSRIKVHKGDVLRFSTRSFHTATLLPAGQVPEQWVKDYATRAGQPWTLLVKDPDEGEDVVKGNNRAFAPSDFTCGGAEQPACSFDGSGGPVNGVLNSGIGPNGFQVKITADPGETIWALCLVHTGMRMRIDVVPAGETASDQSNIDARTTSRIADDTDLAKATHTKLSDRQTKHVTSSGQVVRDAWAGYDVGHVSLFDMYPGRIPLKKGQKVRWHFPQLFLETHTVTFPARRGEAIASKLGTPQCDPDGDDGPGPDTEPTQPPPAFCDNPAQLEFDIPHNAIPTIGNHRYTGAGDFEHSGFRGADSPFPNHRAYNLKFPEVSSEDGFQYACAIHPFMQGRVVVKK